MTSTYRHWWETLIAVPHERVAPDWWTTHPPDDATPYRRLRRVWADQTWTDDRLHQLHKERHLVTTLFENFVRFHPRDWIPVFLKAAGLSIEVGPIVDARWSYDFEIPYPGTKRGKSIADIVLHVRGRDADALVIVEAKRLRTPIGKKDADPAYYLDEETYAACPAEQRRFVYLVDESRVSGTRSRVKPNTPWRWGITSWQALGGLQCELAASHSHAAVSAAISAAAIEFQYRRHNIDLPEKYAGIAVTREVANAVAISVCPEDSRLCSVELELRDLATRRDALQFDILDHEAGFVAGSVDYVLRHNGISTPPLYFYLRDEPAILAAPPQGSCERQEELWRLPDRGA